MGLIAALTMFGASMTAIFWVRSYWIGDRASYTAVWTDTDYIGNDNSKETRCRVASAGGRLTFEVSSDRFIGGEQSSLQRELNQHSRFAYNSFPPTTPIPVGVPPRAGIISQMGFYHWAQETEPFTANRDTVRSRHDSLIAMPYWALCLTLSIIPALVLLVFARRFRESNPPSETTTASR